MSAGAGAGARHGRHVPVWPLSGAALVGGTDCYETHGLARGVGQAKQVLPHPILCCSGAGYTVVQAGYGSTRVPAARLPAARLPAARLPAARAPGAQLLGPLWPPPLPRTHAPTQTRANPGLRFFALALA